MDLTSHAQAQARVREHLQPGETFRAAVWASRAEGQPSAHITRAEISPFRFRRPVPGPGFRDDVQGEPRSLAVALDGHVRTVNDPRVLALTDRRLLLLSKRRGLLGATSDALRLRWECPRADLTSATERDGRLRLTFGDGSAVTLLTPSAQAQLFLSS